MTAKLLLADDSETIQRVIRLTFSGEDVEVITVGDGEEAILRIPLERPDIVLADIGMPKRSGYEVAAFIRDHPELSHVPVLLLAGAFEPVDETRARDVNSAGVLVKPFDPPQVVARVRELVRPVRADERRSRLPPGPATAAASAGPASAAMEDDAGGAPTSLDDYFDRLDAAFATLGTSKPSPPRSTPAVADDGRYLPDVPTLDEVLGTPAGSGGAASRTPDGARPFKTADASTTPGAPAASVRGGASDPPQALADLFHLLLAVEQGRIEAGSVTIAGARTPEISDDFVDRVAERVVARLAPDALRDVAADVVSAIAERLVREEIDRIRRG